MNLDLNTLREMISSTLQEMASVDTNPEDQAAEAAKEAAEAAKEAALEASLEKGETEAAEAAEAAKEADLNRQQNLSPTPPNPSTLPESFEITKGRLRQIIAEELFSAKKQGIL